MKTFRNEATFQSVATTSHGHRMECPGHFLNPECILESKAGHWIKDIVETVTASRFVITSVVIFVAIAVVVLLLSWEVELVGWGLFSEPYDETIEEKQNSLNEREMSVKGHWVPCDEAVKEIGSIVWAGAAIALSNDGRTIAVSFPKEETLGFVRVLHYDRATGKWELRGQDIEDFIGASRKSIALSGDGNILAMGIPRDYLHPELAHVRMYKYSYDKNEWIQIAHIPGESTDQFGAHLDISLDGSIVAVTARRSTHGNHVGRVQVFEINTKDFTWRQLGQDIKGSFGRVDDVAISGDGSVIATGALRHNDWQGQVLVWTYNKKIYRWIQLGDGQDLNEEHSSDCAGFVSLSADGVMLTIGSPVNQENGLQTGKVRTLKFNAVSQTWEKYGQYLYGQDEGEEFGGAVALSKDGKTLAVGSNQPIGEPTGRVRLYQFHEQPKKIMEKEGETIVEKDEGYAYGGSDVILLRNKVKKTPCVRVFQYHETSGFWVQIGHDIIGKEQKAKLAGTGVALSSDGRVVALCSLLIKDSPIRLKPGNIQILQYAEPEKN